MKKILILLTIVLLTQSSASAGMNKIMNAVMESWVGEDLDAAVMQWKYPTSEKTIVGRKLYYWTDVKGYSNTETFSGSNSDIKYCERILEIDKNNKIIGTQWKGNSCKGKMKNLYTKWGNPKLRDKYLGEQL